MLLVGAALSMSACAGAGDTSAGEAVELTYLAGFGTPAESASPRPPAASAPAPVVVPVTVPPSTTTPAASTETTESTESDEPDDGLNPLGGDSPEDRLMPSVVCMGLQEAQDEIQDHGVFFSRSEDATGEGRRQVWDRNWQVIAQEPEPGEPIGERDAVLFVVKYDDDHPNPC